MGNRFFGPVDNPAIGSLRAANGHPTNRSEGIDRTPEAVPRRAHLGLVDREGSRVSRPLNIRTHIRKEAARLPRSVSKCCMELVRESQVLGHASAPFTDHPLDTQRDRDGFRFLAHTANLSNGETPCQSTRAGSPSPHFC